MILKLFAVVTLVAVAGGAHAAGDITAGKEKAQVCAACHGTDGNSANPMWPKLAGQSASYLAKQLSEFKAGKRKDPVMGAQAMGLSDADMQDLAAYLAAQKMSPGAAEQDKVTLGERIYRGGNATTGVAACIGCHGPTGAGNPAANFPRLSGQHAAYVTKTMKDFKSGARSNDAGKMMQTVAGRMSDEEIEAVASYVSGLH